MIKSIPKITGTGKFLNYQQKQIPEENRLPDFQKFNLIYAENGMGKTTLSLVLKSLNERPELMLKKRSFNKKMPQAATVVTEEESYHFTDKHWNQFLTNLEIFDVHFINENIYTGLEMQASHKKNLFEIILGDGGIELKLQIQTLKKRIFNGKKIIRQTAKFIEDNVGNIYSAFDFASLLPDPNIEEKIAEKKHELETANAFQLILDKPVLSPLTSLSLPYEKAFAQTILQQSIDNISTEYLTKIEEHKEHLSSDGNAEEWLKEGIKMADDNCPFCQQSLQNATEIIEAYQQYFNQTYHGLLGNLEAINQQLENYNLSVYLLEMEQQVLKNINLLEFWKKYLPNAPDLTIFKIDKTEITAHFEKVKTIFQEKTSNPIAAVATENLTVFEKLVTQLNQKIAEINEQITNFNSSITLMKTADNPVLSRIELALKQLEAQRKRGEPTMMENCDNLLKYTEGIEQLEAIKSTTQTKLDLFQRDVFKEYLVKINQYLQIFTPYLTIDKLSSGFQGSSTEPVVKFALKVHNNTVAHKESATKPSMKYALSEGDKCALALSFFLAKLSLDTRLQDKIIVFDDALSSFDRYRLSKLLDLLIKIGQQANQFFFLTHNFMLGKEFLNRVSKAEIAGLSCKIETIGDTSALVKFENK